MRFAHLENLWLLLAVPAVVLAYALAFAHRRRLMEKLGDGPLVARMAEVSVPRKVLRAAELTLAVALLAVALARPQAGGRAKLTHQRGLDLVVALDFSKSMLVKDVYPSRIERAKRELERLMDRLAGDRIGLVAFAGEPIAYPPTTDYAAVKLFWRDLSPVDMPVGGTAIGRALRSSLDLLTRLRRAGGESRAQVVLLLTDGEDTESEPLAAAEEASRLGVKVFTIGVGSRSGELVPEIGAEGEVTGYAKDGDDKYVTSRLDEQTLIKIAALTGGEYFPADPRRFGVEQVEAALAGLKRTENEARVIKQYDEVIELLLLPAFLLLVGEACSRERRRRGAGPPVALMVVLLPFLGGWDLLKSPNRSVEAGNQHIKHGKADEALAEYDRAAGKLPADAGVHFNRGSALFALGRFDEAGQAFLRATEAKEVGLKAAAFYNLGNTFYRKGQYKEAVEAYKRSLGLSPKDMRAKWNLELALRKKQQEEEKKKENQGGQKESDQDKDKSKDKDKDRKDKERSKADQGAKDQPKPDGKDGKDENNKGQGEEDQERDPASRAGEPPPPGGKRPEQQEIEAILDSLDRPSNLEKERARLRALHRRPPAKDW